MTWYTISIDTIYLIFKIIFHVTEPDLNAHYCANTHFTLLPTPYVLNAEVEL